jgi:hypothetical protein
VQLKNSRQAHPLPRCTQPDAARVGARQTNNELAASAGSVAAEHLPHIFEIFSQVVPASPTLRQGVRGCVAAFALPSVGCESGFVSMIDCFRDTEGYGR